MISPPWTAEMQALWDRAMLIARTRGAYGCAFPQPGTSFTPPTPGTMLYDICFAALAPSEEYDAWLESLRASMLAWKQRVRDSGNKRRELITKVDVSSIDTSKMVFKL